MWSPDDPHRQLPYLPELRRHDRVWMMADNVNHPPHYTDGRHQLHETIEVIEAWELDFCLGNCVKYISRAGRKGAAVEDLKKARWYLDRAIQTRLDNDASRLHGMDARDAHLADTNSRTD